MLLFAQLLVDVIVRVLLGATTGLAVTAGTRLDITAGRFVIIEGEAEAKEAAAEMKDGIAVSIADP